MLSHNNNFIKYIRSRSLQLGDKIYCDSIALISFYCKSDQIICFFLVVFNGKSK